LQSFFLFLHIKAILTGFESNNLIGGILFLLIERNKTWSYANSGNELLPTHPYLQIQYAIKYVYFNAL